MIAASSGQHMLTHACEQHVHEVKLIRLPEGFYSHCHSIPTKLEQVRKIRKQCHACLCTWPQPPYISTDAALHSFSTNSSPTPVRRSHLTQRCRFDLQRHPSYWLSQGMTCCKIASLPSLPLTPYLSVGRTWPKKSKMAAMFDLFLAQKVPLGQPLPFWKV